MRPFGLRALGIASVLTMLAGTWMARAQSADCPAITGVNGHKVLVDDVRDDGTAVQRQTEVDSFRNKLYFQLKANADQLEADFAELAPRGSRCKGRWPSEGELADDMAKFLNGRDVVVEVWGTAGLEPGSDGKLYPSALLNYALIPVRRYQEELGNLRWTYPAQIQEKEGTTAGMPDFSETARQLQVFFTLSAGVKTLKSKDKGRDYGQALKLFCRSAALIASKGEPALGSDDARLLARVRGLAHDTVTQAIADIGYGKTPGGRSLALLSPAQQAAPCGGVNP